MDVRAVSRGRPTTGGPQPMGVSAQLADARARLRALTPPGSLDAVMAEVERVRTKRSLSLLAALQLVHAKLAAGWLPPPPS